MTYDWKVTIKFKDGTTAEAHLWNMTMQQAEAAVNTNYRNAQTRAIYLTHKVKE